jgi:MFS family permease
MTEVGMRSNPWTKRDCLHIVLAVMIKFGDGVEIYLPGVITQTASCELGVTKTQEGFLAVILFVFFAGSILMAVPLCRQFGERIILLLSLYTSILFAVLCALVPNYWTLLVSRALIGLCVGLNASTIGVFLAKNASSREVANISSFIQGSVAFTLGGGWVSIFGWLILDLVGWRNFVLFTSIPVFLPPILMLHCCIKDEHNLKTRKVLDDKCRYSSSECSRASSPESKRSMSSESRRTKSSESCELSATESDYLLEKKFTAVPNFAARVFKAALFVACNVCIGYGSIILLPAVIRSYKEHEHFDYHHERDIRIEPADPTDATNAIDTRCQSVVQGSDLLIVAAVTGGANVIGRPLGYIFRKIISFRVLQSLVAVTIALSYGLMITTPSLAVSSLLMGLAKLGYSIQGAEASVIPFDASYLGYDGLTLGAGIVSSSGMIGAILGTSLAAFLVPHIAVIVTLAISVTQILVICFMSER